MCGGWTTTWFPYVRSAAIRSIRCLDSSGAGTIVDSAARSCAASARCVLTSVPVFHDSPCNGCPICANCYQHIVRKVHNLVRGTVPCLLALTHFCFKLQLGLNIDDGVDILTTLGPNSDQAVKRKPNVGEDMIRICKNCHYSLTSSVKTIEEQRKAKSRVCPVPSLPFHAYLKIVF